MDIGSANAPAPDMSIFKIPPEKIQNASELAQKIRPQIQDSDQLAREAKTRAELTQEAAIREELTNAATNLVKENEVTLAGPKELQEYLDTEGKLLKLQQERFREGAQALEQVFKLYDRLTVLNKELHIDKGYGEAEIKKLTDEAVLLIAQINELAPKTGVPNLAFELEQRRVDQQKSLGMNLTRKRDLPTPVENRTA